MKNLFQVTYITLCSIFLLGLNSCQKNEASDIQSEKNLGLSAKIGNADAAPFLFRAIDANFNPVSMKFTIACAGVSINTNSNTGRINYDPSCNNIYVGITNMQGTNICLLKNAVYYFIPNVGPKGKCALKVKFGTNFNGANLGLFTYNTFTGKWSTNVPPNDFSWANYGGPTYDCD